MIFSISILNFLKFPIVRLKICQRSQIYVLMICPIVIEKMQTIIAKSAFGFVEIMKFTQLSLFQRQNFFLKNH